MLANFMLGKKTFSFSIEPVSVKTQFENEEVRDEVLSRSYRELGMN